MPRPLMQHGVGQLEEMFGGCRGSLQVLRQLENELQYRQVPRALALLEKVQVAMAASGDVQIKQTSRAPTVPPATPRQPDLWGRAPVPEVVPVTLPPASSVVAAPPPLAPSPTPPIRPADTPVAVRSTAPPVPTMPLEDAYKLLKATAGSTWESIEQTRRQLVEQAHPSRLKSCIPERRASALAEARRVNAAYAALSQARCRAT